MVNLRLLDELVGYVEVVIDGGVMVVLSLLWASIDGGRIRSYICRWRGDGL